MKFPWGELSLGVVRELSLQFPFDFRYERVEGRQVVDVWDDVKRFFEIVPGVFPPRPVRNPHKFEAFHAVDTGGKFGVRAGHPEVQRCVRSDVLGGNFEERAEAESGNWGKYMPGFNKGVSHALFECSGP